MPIETQLQPRRDHVVTSLRIEVVDGPDRGKQIVGADAQLSVGTAPDNALVLTDFTVSRFHLEASVRPSGISIVDLGSTNGPVHKWKRVDRLRLASGDEFEIGEATIRYEEE